VAVLVVVDGLFGPQLSPRNLAGVLPWVHWRGLVVLTLLVAGNAFCMACPFMLPRRLAKKILPRRRPWPRALRSKWLAASLLILFFWAYEALDLWASPWLTAWLVVAYFAGAFLIDGLFRGAAFCKHVCPIGQFHFVNSMVSPFEVAVRESERCIACRTKDCIGGREVGGRVQNGCELWLFQQRKVGNLDCTFCMECIHACPHDNVGILVRNPARELYDDSWRSGLGRLGQRPDLAALVLVLVFSAFLNAFGMVSPVYGLLASMSRLLGTTSEAVPLLLLFLGGVVVLPAVLILGAATLTRRWTGATLPVTQIGTRFTFSLVPMGFAMWLAHYFFHFATGGLVLFPLLQKYLADLGLPLGSPRTGSGTLVPEGWILPIQTVALEMGLLLSAAVAFRISLDIFGDRRVALRASLPWVAIAVALSLAGIWLLLQPMEMRGTFMAG
jgi:hypothetical protein